MTAVPAARWKPLWPLLEPLIREHQPERARWPRPNADGWIGPIHSLLREDARPSFSVKPDSETDPGAWKDHATGEHGSMADLARLLDLDPRQSHSSPPTSIPAPAPERTLPEFCHRRKLDQQALKAVWRVSETTYKDRQALRFPTDIGRDRIKYLDGQKPKNDWMPGKGGRHLYGMAQAQEIGGETLYIGNGETAVWACIQSRVPAVCFAAGEGVEPTDEMVEQLKTSEFERFCLVYDLDKAGREGAPKIVQILRAAGLDAVALELPAELGHGGDVDDLHRRTGDDGLAAALAALPVLETCDSLTVSGTVCRMVRSLTVGELLSLDLPPREMALHPVVRVKDILLIYSWRGLGKSWLAHALAVSFASGCEVIPGWKPTRAFRVVLVDGELPIESLRERFAALIQALPDEFDPAMLRVIAADAQEHGLPDLATVEGRQIIEAAIGDAEVVIIDNRSTLVRSGVENERESWLPLQEWLLSLRRQGRTVALLHHSGKGGAQRGTSAHEDILDTVMRLKAPGDDHPSTGARFVVEFEKNRNAHGEAVEPFELSLVPGSGGGLTWARRSVEDAITRQAAELFADRLSVRDVAAELGISKSRAHRLKKALER